MSSRKIAVCSVGNPLASSTWSGTPANICRSLADLARLTETLDSSACAHPRIKQIASILSRYYYRCSVDTGRGRFHRYLRARYVNGVFKTRDSTDVLHTGTLDLPLPVMPRGIRHFLFCDSTWDLWRRGSSNTSFYSDKLLADAERLEQMSYRQMSHIFPISEYVRHSLMTHYRIPPERITVVGTGRGAIKPYRGTKDYENSTVLFVAKGRFEDKGGQLLLEGFKRAWQRNSRLRLVVVGDERNRKLIGDIPNVEVHGFVALEQLQSFFDQAALFAMPAINEPWGLVYLEALSCKTPVMGLNRNGLPEITEQGRFGFCLDNATAEGVAEGLLEAFRLPERLAKMGAEGQEACLRKFTWENTVNRMVEAIDRCGTSPAGGELRN